MQLKKIRTGVVYAEHRNSQYSADTGTPVVVLDTAVWTHRGSYGRGRGSYRRTPGARPGVDRGFGGPSETRGLPVLALHGAGWQERCRPTDADLDELGRVAAAVSMELRGERVPTDLANIGNFRAEVQIVNPREIQAGWADYVTERRKAEEDQRRLDAAARERLDRAECERRDAVDRIVAVLPEYPLLTSRTQYRVPHELTLSWPELAALLDAYADARTLAP
jgi:hypothetical protein